MPILEIKISWDEIVELARKSDRLVYAFHTVWWKLGNPVYQHPTNRLPCGPRREMLFEMNDPMIFINGAMKNERHYGKHGLLALAAAYHGNIVTESGLPTSMDSWDDVNRLIDEQYPDQPHCRHDWLKKIREGA